MSAVTQIAPMAPVSWLALDLETGDAPEEAVTAAVEGWKPPSNIKDAEKIEARRQEAADKIRDKAALLDASPILCVCIQTDRGLHAFNGMDGSRPEIQGWFVWSCMNEAGMLIALRAWLDANTDPGTVLVGHNVRGFDLPKLRQAYIRHGLKLPEILRPRLRGEESAELVDTMALCKSFSMEHRDDFAIGLETMAAVLGIPRPKAVISGADVPRLHREGQYAAILTYCAVDTACTARAYLLMTSQAGDLQ